MSVPEAKHSCWEYTHRAGPSPSTVYQHLCSTLSPNHHETELTPAGGSRDGAVAVSSTVKIQLI